MQFIYSLLALLAGGLVHAQTLSGRVSTLQNQPLDGAHIHTGTLHGLTRPDGYYELHRLPSGPNRIVFSYIGYKSLDTLINVQGDLRLDVILKPENTQLQEVVLTQNATAKSPVHEDRITTKTLERYSNATLGDALREVAGVYSLRTGSNIVKPVINGLHSSRVPVIANNVRLEDQQWGTEHAPNIDVNAAGRVAVIKGANALQYGGDAIGGLVLVEPLTVRNDTLFGKTLVTGASNGRGGSISSSLHKGANLGWAWDATGTFKYFGDREAPGYVISNTGNREGNFSGNLHYFGESHRFSASYSFYNTTIGIAKAMHIGNVADLVRAINNEQPAVTEPFTYTIGNPRQEVRHHLAKVLFTKDWDDGTSLSAQYAFQRNHREEYDIRRGDYADIPALDLTLGTHSAQADWKKIAGSTTWKGGLALALQHNEASPDTGVRPLIPIYDKFDAGAYGIASHFFTEKFSAEAGLRYDFSRLEAQKFYQKTRWASQGYDGVYNHFITGDYGSQWLVSPQFTFHNVSASLGIRQKLNTLEFFVNAGLSMRNPNASELFSDGLHHANGTIELGNLGLGRETSYKLSATLLKNDGDFTFEFTPYLNVVSGFIYLAPSGIEYTIRGAFPVYNYRQDNALLAGADVQARTDIGSGFSHALNLAFIHGTNTTRNEPLTDMPPLNISNTLRYANSQWLGFFAEMRSEAVFRQPRYPDYNFIAQVPQDGNLVPVAVDVSTPPPGYHLVHLATGVEMPFGKSALAMGVSVNNAFNAGYRDYLNRQRLYTDDVGRNILIQLKFSY